MKRLTVAVALDDECGMMFNNRRQSRDRVMRVWRSGMEEPFSHLDTA